jgi:hypothetical protein
MVYMAMWEYLMIIIWWWSLQGVLCNCIKQTPYHVDEICHGILWQMHLYEKLHLKSKVYQLYLSSLTFTLTSWMLQLKPNYHFSSNDINKIWIWGEKYLKPNISQTLWYIVDWLRGKLGHIYKVKTLLCSLIGLNVQPIK